MLARKIAIAAVLVLIFSVCAPAVPEAAANTNFPTRPIEIIVPVRPGGDTDRNTRVLAEIMSRYLPVSVVVTNIDGASTILAKHHVLDAPADGYKLIINGTDAFVPYMLGVTDVSLRSFATVAIAIDDNTTVLAVHKDSGWNSLEELVLATRERPNAIEYGGRLGSANHICGIAMNELWDAHMRFVDVGNNAAKMAALLARQTDVINISYSLALDYFQSGEFIALCLLGSIPHPTLGVPLASELGFKDADFSKFFWVGAHPDTPRERMQILADAIRQAVANPDFIANMESHYLTPLFIPLEEGHQYALDFYESHMHPWTDLFRAAQ